MAMSQQSVLISILKVANGVDHDLISATKYTEETHAHTLSSISTTYDL